MKRRKKRLFIPILLAIAGAYLVSIFFGAMLGGLVWFWQRARQRQKYIRTPQRTLHLSLQRELPDLIIFFSIALSAGLTVRLALETIANEIQSEILPASRKILVEALNSVRLGTPFIEALQNTPPALAPLIVPLVDSERYGAELLPALYRAGKQAREQNRHLAEARARKVPIKLLFPLVVCFLPAFCLLTLAPVFVRSLQLIDL